MYFGENQRRGTFELGFFPIENFNVLNNYIIDHALARYAEYIYYPYPSFVCCFMFMEMIKQNKTKNNSVGSRSFF